MSYLGKNQLVWKAQVLDEFEKVAQLSTFLIPGPLTGIAIISLKRKKS
jgi:hypothetical protein